jgi:hypothetical protein
LNDRTLEDIEKEFKILLSKSDDPNKKVLYFLYYSGYGSMCNAMVYGHTIIGKHIPIDAYARTLSKNQNSYSIAFFDCSRVNEVIPQDILSLYGLEDS